jgi:hypothetical protein
MPKKKKKKRERERDDDQQAGGVACIRGWWGELAGPTATRGSGSRGAQRWGGRV